MKRSNGEWLPDRIRVVAVEPTTTVIEQEKNTALVGRPTEEIDGNRAVGQIEEGGERMFDSEAGRTSAVSDESSEHGTVPAARQSAIEFDDAPEPGLYEPRREKLGRTEMVAESQLKLLMVGGVLILLVLAEICFFVVSVILSVRTGDVEGLQQFYSQIFTLLVPILVGVGGYFFGRQVGKRS